MSSPSKVGAEVPEQIMHEIVVDAPVERVWAIITEAEHIREWFAFDGAEIDLRPGGALVMTWKEHGTYHACIEQIEPERLFSYRWAHLADQQPGDGNSTLVEFTLSPEGDATRLRVVESGFRDLDMPEAEQAAWAADNVQGWTGGFAALQEYAQRIAA
jgi:uncharacterized protein YndB with AHSA1/START domain